MKKNFRYWFSALPFFLALKFFLLYTVKKIFRIPVNFFYSQTGEDILISYMLRLKGNGFYVDVGCNEPIQKSNTFSFYLMGWKGITIDANNELIKMHKKVRLLDTSLCAAISNSIKEVTFYKSQENAVSTISEDFYNENKKNWAYTDKQTLITKTLTSILDEKLPQNTKIDLLTVDVEGIDLEVLEGLDFSKYRPELIVVEGHNFSLNNKESHPLYQYLEKNSYRLQGFAIMNAYFIDASLNGLDLID